MMRNKILTILFFFALLPFFNGELQAASIFQQVGIASSPNPVGSGARALGMGGAFIGVADDATAASWNPAGLIQLEKPELSIVGEYFSRSDEFSSDQHPEIDNTADVDDFNLNYFSATYPFHFYRNMVVSINYQRLYDFKRSFDYRFDFSDAGLDVMQDKSFDQDGFLGALGFAASIEIIPKLSFGATLNIWTDQLLWDNGWDAKFSEGAVGTLAGSPVTINTKIKDDYSEFRGINANFGLLWNINQYFTLGGVIKTPFKASLKHEFSFDQVQTFGAPVNTVITSQENFTENVDLYMPLSYGAGLAVRFSDVFTMDIDVYRTDWSDFFLKDGQGNKFSPIDGRPKSESNVKDTTQVRIGGEYLFISQKNNIIVPLRAGLFYDPEPSEDEVKDFYGIAVGSGIAYKQFIFDAAYQFRWGNNVDTGNLIATSKDDVRQHSVLASIIFHF
jgi:long-subunit fatty acid transport protein